MGNRARLGVALALVVVAGALGWWLSRPDAPPVPGEGAGRGEGSSTLPDPEPAPPGPSGEREPEAEPPEPAPPLVVRVLDPDGHPRAGARVFLLSEGAVRGKGETGEAGNWEIPAPGGEGEVVVLALGAAAHRQPTSLDSGEIEIRLPRGVALSGRVIVDGAPPAEIVRLHLWSHSGMPGTDGLPREVRSAAQSLSFDTAREGTFRVTGLPEGWSGFLGVERSEYVLVKPPGNGIIFAVSAPRDDLEVHIRPKPVLAGRVLRPGGEEVVEGAKVRLHYRTANGGGGQRVLTGDDGRFRLPMYTTEVVSGEIVVVDAEGLGEVRLTVDRARFELGHDFGDIVLAEIRTLTLNVRDASGEPIEGAVALAATDGRIRSEPTDAGGSTTIRVSDSVPVLRVGAVGTAVVDVAIPDGRGAGSLTVTLPAGNVLSIRVLDPSGEPSRGVRVSLRTDGTMFSSRSGGPDTVLAVAGAARPVGGSWSDEESATTYDTDEDGRVVVAGLRPGAVIDVSAVDSGTGATLAKSRVEVVATGREEVLLRPEASARTLLARIVDGDGDPVPSARVWLGRVFRMADDHGACRIEGIRASPLPLEIQAGGFAPLLRPEFEVPKDGREVTFVLEAGHTVRLEVVDSAGRPVPSDEVGIEGLDMGRGWFAGEESSGVRVLVSLPGGEQRLFAEVAGRRFHLRHDTTKPRARLVVPALGAVSVRIRDPQEKAVIHRLRLAPLDESGAEVMVHVNIVQTPGERDIELPVVLPGRYRVHLEVWVNHEEGEHVYGPAIEGPIIRVIAGETMKVSLVE